MEKSLKTDTSNLKDPQTYQEVKRVIALLHKTIKSLLFYPSSNPIPEEFKKELLSKLVDFLEKEELIRLSVNSNQLLYEKEVVYSDLSHTGQPTKDEGLAFAFYRDGIREISFLNGLEKEELAEFLELIKHSLTRVGLEDDLVTLLWEKDFPHIKYMVSEDSFEETEPQIVSDSKKPNQILYSEVILEETSKDTPTEDGNELKVINEFLKNIENFSLEERKEIEDFLGLEKKYNPTKEIISVLKEFLYSESEMDEFKETVNLANQTLDSLLQQEEFEVALELAQLFKNVSLELKSTKPSKAELCSEAYRQTGSKERIQLITQLLNEKKDINLTGVASYLSSLPWNVWPSFVTMLKELSHFSARKMVCSILEKVDSEHLSLVGNGIYEKEWYVVRNIVMVLGKLGSKWSYPENERVLEYLKKPLQNPDIRVRKETINSLAKIPQQKSNQLLFSALEDEESKIRKLALGILVERQEKKVFDFLKELISSKDFIYKSEEEKRELLKALVQVDEKRALPLIEKIIRQRSWFKKSKKKETKLQALRALAHSNSSEVFSLLEKYSKKGEKVIRQLCLKLLSDK
jgi:HEAT repeat protein